MRKKHQPIDYSKLPKAAKKLMRDNGWHEWKSCYSKRQFATEALTQREGMRPYQCEICGRWHHATVRK